MRDQTKMRKIVAIALIIALLPAWTPSAPADTSPAFANSVSEALNNTQISVTSGFLNSPQGVGVAFQHRLGPANPVTIHGSASTGPDNHYSARLGLKIAF